MSFLFICDTLNYYCFVALITILCVLTPSNISTVCPALIVFFELFVYGQAQKGGGVGVAVLKLVLLK